MTDILIAASAAFVASLAASHVTRRIFAVFRPSAPPADLVLHVGQSVLVRLDPDADVWTPGTVRGFKSNTEHGKSWNVVLVQLGDNGSTWQVGPKAVRLQPPVDDAEAPEPASRGPFR